MPSVTMKLGALVIFTRSPVSAPLKPAVPTQMAKAAKGPSAEFCTREAQTVPDSAITDAIERSMPPLPITKVLPIASSPVTAEAARILSKFERERKCGDRKENVVTSTAKKSRHRRELNRASRRRRKRLSNIA
jgi:hypothetical protein